MFVEEITIDGFKSYAQRVTVPGFDRHFNAITGLNGTGKSNILDSICFVLGITNLSQVRASTLQDLVYKQGQAGVTKATVSVTFNNEDKANSPVGYEHCDKLTVTRQVVIGGRNKYMINGSTAQPNRVQNLFHSVQLNVNNPHFLIMQGRITKVLNMKPPEILSMLEEAAGTRMYETKKETALRTLAKKQVKMDDIDKVLNEEIRPALDKLRKERGEYMQWATRGSQLEQLRRFCIAYNYSTGLQKMASCATTKDEIVSLQDSIRTQKSDLEQRVKDLKRQLQVVLKDKDARVATEIKGLQDQQDTLSKDLVRCTSAWTNKKEALSAEVVQKENLEKAAEEYASGSLQRKFDRAKEEADAAKAAFAAAQNATRNAECELEGYKTGDCRDQSGRGLKERLADAQNALATCDPEIKSRKMEADHISKELSATQKVAKKKESENSKLVKELQKAEGQVDVARKGLEGIAFDPKAKDAVAQKMKAEEKAASQWHEKVQKLKAQLSGLDFRFKDPSANFDRSKVKGVVAKLMHVQDPSANAALEVIAGGKLYQVVVDSADCAKALLQKGQLKSRVTIIPLDKISSRTLSQDKIKAAEEQVQDRATPALSLVGFDDDLSRAMKYVFGNAFVCKDAQTAKTVAYHKLISAHCATLDGDFYDPSGTLSGGSSKSMPSTLSRLHALAEAEEKFGMHQSNVHKLKAQYKSLEASAKKYYNLTKDLDLKEHSLGLLKKRLEGSEAMQLGAQVQDLQKALDAAKAAHDEAVSRKDDLKKQVKQFEKELSLVGKQQKELVKIGERKIKECAKLEQAAKKAMEKLAQELQGVAAELDSASVDQSRLMESIQGAEQTIKELQEECVHAENAVAEKKSEYEELTAVLDSKKEGLRQCDEEAKSIGTEIENTQTEMGELDIKSKKLGHKLANVDKDTSDAAESVRHLAKKYPWIESEKQFFGVEGTDYDWHSKDPEHESEKLLELEAEQNKRAKRINKKVMNMFDKAESELHQLTEKKRIVKNDKESIERVIAELDEKKRETLEKTWKKVNKDFGSIFSTLLPGTSAKLEPPEELSFMEGLEVKVAFGDVWKESLSELSGGQRSLLALSLILALLLFKPAPIYILDEVDAALDLSHTQNIGRMIKAHFPHSQFIVVSLKEGMFNNADVLFRTKFVDGVSCVTRNSIKKRSGVQPASKKAKQGAAANKENTPTSLRA